MPVFTTLISTIELASHLTDPTWVIVDCRFDLTNPAWGEAQYRAGHIPRAAYAHLDRDLAGPKTATSGRHPLPDLDRFKTQLGQWGIGPGMQVVAYDQLTGMWASRLWWMLRYLGHTAVAVLEGGSARWLAEGRPFRTEAETPTPTEFVGEPRPEMLITTTALETLYTHPQYRLVDSRAPERYRGEVEPIDPVAGHIPNAVNYFNLSHINAAGEWLPTDALRARFTALLGEGPSTQCITYCGSGVAATHNALALEVAGLSGAKVYIGSWSEWCRDPARPIATGPT